jgi:hypothetical protein
MRSTVTQEDIDLWSQGQASHLPGPLVMTATRTTTLGQLVVALVDGLIEVLPRVHGMTIGYDDDGLAELSAFIFAALPAAPSLDHPRTYHLTASGPKKELFLVTDDESGMRIGYAPKIGGPLTSPATPPDEWDTTVENIHRAFCDPEHEKVGDWDREMAAALHRNGYVIRPTGDAGRSRSSIRPKASAGGTDA